MISEKNVLVENKEHFQHQCSLMRDAFIARRVNFHEINSLDEVSNFIKSFILEKECKKIAFSDSVTLHECDVFDMVYSNFSTSNYQIINPFERTEDGKYKVFEDQPLGQKLDLPKEEYFARMNVVIKKMREALLSDVFIIGANAITLKGEIISIDGSGNRVAGMMFGPKYVIVVVGKNKICTDSEEALKRIRNVAAPLNYIRHNIKHHNRYDDLPCVKKGKCYDCSHPRSACRKIVVCRGEVEANADRIHLLVVNENLGY